MIFVVFLNEVFIEHIENSDLKKNSVKMAKRMIVSIII